MSPEFVEVLLAYIDARVAEHAAASHHDEGLAVGLRRRELADELRKLAQKEGGAK